MPSIAVSELTPEVQLWHTATRLNCFGSPTTGGGVHQGREICPLIRSSPLLHARPLRQLLLRLLQAHRLRQLSWPPLGNCSWPSTPDLAKRRRLTTRLLGWLAWEGLTPASW